MNRIDELKAEIENAERNLDGLKTYLSKKKEELERLTAIADIKKGDYVRVKIDSVEFIGRFDGIVNGIPKINSFKSFSGEAFSVVKKWQPQKGDLCIFWDNEYKDSSCIDIFSIFENGMYADRDGVHFDNCIPFISIEQFKEHIGYEQLFSRLHLSWLR